MHPFGSGDLANRVGWFIDLFVREDNHVAARMYKLLAYAVYRKLMKYYDDRYAALGTLHARSSCSWRRLGHDMPAYG